LFRLSCGHRRLKFQKRSQQFDHRGVDLISDVLPFGRLLYDTPDNAIGYAMRRSRSHKAVLRVYDSGQQRDRNVRAQWRFQGNREHIFLNRYTIFDSRRHRQAGGGNVPQDWLR